MWSTVFGLIALLCAVAIFNAIILFHELGHFLAAKWRGLDVSALRIWFGPAIWKRKFAGTEFSLGCIPAGGYVLIPELEPTCDSPSTISPMDRLIVAFAGPVFSLTLAVFCGATVGLVGRPVGEAERTRIIGFVPTDSVAFDDGFREGDEVLSIDNGPVTKFSGAPDGITWNVFVHGGFTREFTVLRDGKQQKIIAHPSANTGAGNWRGAVRHVDIFPQLTSRIISVEPGSPAESGGLMAGDKIVAVDGQIVLHPAAVSAAAQGSKPIELTVDRGGSLRQVIIAPEDPAHTGQKKLGVTYDLMGDRVLRYPDGIEQVTGSLTVLVETFRALLSSNSGITIDQMSGPIGILHSYYLLLTRSDGWRMALWFSVILNVNLALINLVPLPVLDGGHMVLSIVEQTTGRPVNGRLLRLAQRVCVYALIVSMAYVTLYDLADLIAH